MGRGQVVRQPVLTLLFGGSNPSAPVTGKKQQLKELARIPKYLRDQVSRIPDAGSVPGSVR